MAERQTLLARNLSSAPTVQPAQTGVPQGAFGDYRGLVALGQGISQAGEAGARYAITARDVDRRAAEELRKQRALEAKNQVQITLDRAFLAYQDEKIRLREEGKLAEAPLEHTKTSLDRAFSVAKEQIHQMGFLQNPEYAQFASEEAISTAWGKMVDREAEAASREQWEVDLKRRTEKYDLRAFNAFSSIDPRDYDGTLKAAAELRQDLFSSNLPGKIERLVTLSRSVRETALRGLEYGVQIPDTVINSDLLSADDRQALHHANARFLEKNKEKTPESVGDSIKTIRNIADVAMKSGNTGLLNPAQNEELQAAMRAVQEKETTAAAKDWANNFRLLTEKKMLFEKALFELPGSHKRATDVKNWASDRNDPKSFDLRMREAFGLTEEQVISLGDDWTVAKEHVLKRSEEYLEAVRKNQASVLYGRTFDGMTQTRRFMDRLNRTDGVFDRELLSQFVAGARRHQTEAGIPKEQHDYMPHELRSLIFDKLQAGQVDQALNLVDVTTETIGSVGEDTKFAGVQAIHHLANYAALKGDPKSLSLAGFLFFKAQDAASQIGEGARKESALKPIQNEVVTQILRRDFTKEDGDVKAMVDVILSTQSLEDPVTYGEVLAGKQLTPDRDNLQALPFLINSVRRQYAPHMADAVQTFFRSYLTQAPQDIAPDLKQEAKMHTVAGKVKIAGDNLARMVFGSAALVESDYDGSVSTLVPNRSTREGPFDFPMERGAGTTADYSRQLGDGLKYVLYYHPRTSWTRQDWMSNTVDFLSAFFRNTAGPTVSTGAQSVLPLPKELQIDYGNIAGLGIDRMQFKDQDRPIKEWWENARNAESWIAILISQKGYFQYDTVNDRFDLFLRPGMHTVPNVPAIHDVGSPIRVLYHGNVPVSIPGARFRQFVDAYRSARVPSGREGYDPFTLIPYRTAK